MSEAPRLGRLNHVGVVVRDLGSAESAWRRLFGLPAANVAPQAAAGVEYVALDCGGLILELIQPRAGDTSYAAFLRQHGEGVHHLCFEVSDLEAWRQTDAAAALPNLPIRTVADRKMIDLPPDTFGGVSIQLCEFIRPA